MYIVHLGDLHIGSKQPCGDSEEQILKSGVEKIKQDIPAGQQLLICVCGDMIDSKNLPCRKKATAKKRYKVAAALLKLMERQLTDYSVDFQFCVGNHDVTHMDEFISFFRQFDKNISEDDLKSCYDHPAGGIHFIFINSCCNGNYAYGEIDYDRLEQLLESIPEEDPKIFVMHHTVMSMYPDDSSSIRDSARLLQLIEKNHVLGVLHGHIHGNELFPLGSKMCRMIGTGALFSRGNPNVCSQFNLIDVDPFAFRTISTCIYLADRRSSGNHWYTISLQEAGNENYFQGPDFETVHQALLGKLHHHKPVLNNVLLQINNTYEKFVENLELYLKNDTLTMGKKEFTYSELAEMWESEEPPPELYFNHGKLFKSSGNCGTRSGHAIHEIAQQIKNVPTSNRAILTTFDTETALATRRSDDYLPSLLSVQFSLDPERDTIYVHMSLRALEAESFLKINICEIKWMLKQLKNDNVLFGNVDIAISAFRVQCRKRFKCFLKAEIDRLDPIELTPFVYKGQLTKICDMLEEKKDSSETITNVEGIKSLHEAMQQSNKNNFHTYSDEIIQKLESLQETYASIHQLHQKSSIKTQEEDDCEKQIQRELGEIISMLRQEEGASKS